MKGLIMKKDVDILYKALEKIAKINYKVEGGDWDEIE
jgi:hypothetical protein